MKKKIVIISLIIIILTSGLFILTGCVKNENKENNVNNAANVNNGNTKTVSNNSENKESSNDNTLENNNFYVKDHRGYYNEEKDKYVIEGTIVNKTDKTFENSSVMFRTIAANDKVTNLASCTIEKLEPHGEVKFTATTPTLDTNAMEIVRYELSGL